MNNKKHVKDFVVPREIRPTDIARAFQSIKTSLNNLETAVNAPADTREIDELRAVVQQLEREQRARLQPQPIAKTVRTETELVFSSRI